MFEGNIDECMSWQTDKMSVKHFWFQSNLIKFTQTHTHSHIHIHSYRDWKKTQRHKRRTIDLNNKYC